MRKICEHKKCQCAEKQCDFPNCPEKKFDFEYCFEHFVLSEFVEGKIQAVAEKLREEMNNL